MDIPVNNVLHITSGDVAGKRLSRAGLSGEIFVWHDILYDGPRTPGWPDSETLLARSEFLEQATGGGLSKEDVLEVLEKQYQKLAGAGDYARIVLWFDACLFDQSMLCHILTCLDHRAIRTVELLCVDYFPGIVPYHGLGQLTPDQLARVYDRRVTVTDAQFEFAKQVDKAFASQDQSLFSIFSKADHSPLPWVAAAVRRWLQEQPAPNTGLGRLEQLALNAIESGLEKPWEIFNAVAAADTPPQYWGDITLWAKINALADRKPALVRITGPADRLPQWVDHDLSGYRVYPMPADGPSWVKGAGSGESLWNLGGNCANAVPEDSGPRG